MTAATESIRFPRALALKVAEELRTLLSNCVEANGAITDTFEQITIVGSTRRGKETVKDLELLFIPRAVIVADPLSLIGETLQVSAVNLALDHLVGAGVLAKRPKCDGTCTWGDSIRLAVHVESGLPVDFFACTRETWFNQLVCRTGGKESNTRIATQARERGLKWNPFGPGFTNLRNGKHARTVRSEQDVFTIVGLDYLEPHQRP